MGRITLFRDFFLMYVHFWCTVLNKVMEYALANITLAILFCLILYFIYAIATSVPNKFLAFVLILFLVIVEFSIVTSFVISLGWYSLFLTGLVILAILVEMLFVSKE